MGQIVLTANTSWYLANFRSGLIRALQRHGHTVTVVAPIDAHTEALSRLGCRTQALTMDSKGTHPVRDGRLLLSAWRHLHELRPDAVLSYTVKNNIYFGFAARSLGIPFIPNVSGLGTAFSEDSWLMQVVMALSRAAFRPLPMVMFQNEEDRATFVERGIVLRERTIRVGGSGVDLAHFAASPLPNGPEVVFLLVARLLWDKGVGEFVEAARRLRAQGAPVRCRLLGFLDVKNRGAIDRATVEAWQAEGVIDYLGSTSDVRPALQSADCIVLPSFYREGVPRSLLEGSAMGRPVITTDMPGCRDTLVDGVTGFLCAPHSVDSLMSAISKIVELGGEGRQKMGLAARAHMEHVFDEAHVVDAYLTWLAQQLAKT